MSLIKQCQPGLFLTPIGLAHVFQQETELMKFVTWWDPLAEKTPGVDPLCSSAGYGHDVGALQWQGIEFDPWSNSELYEERPCSGNRENRSPVEWSGVE